MFIKTKYIYLQGDHKTNIKNLFYDPKKYNKYKYISLHEINAVFFLNFMVFQEPCSLSVSMRRPGV